jgi:hypothetical protein
MGCSCKLCRHSYGSECEGPHCKCCSDSEHLMDISIENEDELSHMLETKYLEIPS